MKAYMMCESQVPAAPCWPEGSWTFHSTTIAPAAVDQVRSVTCHFFQCKANRRTRSASREDDIRNLSNTRRACSSDLDDGARVVVVLKVGAGSKNRRPRLTDDLHTGRDGKRIGDDVDTSVDEDDLASGVLVEDVLECRSVVGLAITLCSLGFDADELVDAVAFVLRVTLGEDPSSTVGEDSGLREGGDATVSECLRVCGTVVLVAKSPCIDSSVSGELSSNAQHQRKICAEI